MTGNLLLLISVAGAGGITIGGLPVQVVRYSWAIPVAILAFYLAFLIKQDLAVNRFSD